MKKVNWIINGPNAGPCNVQHREELIREAVRWFLERYCMQYHGDGDEVENRYLVINFNQYERLNCWGQCYEWDVEGVDTDYVIDLAYDQNTRDLLATLFHECVHLWQWERGHWKGEGEREACQLQYELADDYWKCGNVHT